MPLCIQLSTTFFRRQTLRKRGSTITILLCVNSITSWLCRNCFSCIKIKHISFPFLQVRLSGIEGYGIYCFLTGLRSNIFSVLCLLKTKKMRNIGYFFITTDLETSLKSVQNFSFYILYKFFFSLKYVCLINFKQVLLSRQWVNINANVM